MMTSRFLTVCASVLVISGFAIAADSGKFAAKCIVAGKPDAKESKFSEYKSAKVYFCCDNCKGKFDADPAKFEVAANHQLAVTGQYVQKKCPMSGGPLDATKTVEVAGAKVAFCCENCQGKAQKTAEADRKALLFNNKSFEKAYVLAKE